MGPTTVPKTFKSTCNGVFIPFMIWLWLWLWLWFM
jgi:hypothetical protein